MIASLSTRDRLDVEVLEALYAARGSLTPFQLARQLSREEADVGGSLHRLRGAGCVFDEHPQHGLRLVEAGLGMWRLRLARELALPETAVHVYRRTSSTQDRAREDVERGGQSSPRLVIADEQSAGRGRLGRRWQAPPGSSLLLTLAVPLPAARRRGVEPITAYAAVALLEAIERVTGVQPALKWPNDVVHDGRKVAGILVERVDAPPGSFALIGIGVNVNHPEPAPLENASPLAHDGQSSPRLRPAWLSDAIGRRLDRLPLLTEIVRQALRWSRRPDRDAALHRWRRSCTTLGQHHRFVSNGREIAGDVLDVDLDEGLILRRDTGELLHLPAASTTVL